MPVGRIIAVSAAVVGVIASGCIDTDIESIELGLAAACEANVIGVGVVDVENDYLPSVVNCENGAASFEALKAQAVAARSYLYYRLEVSGDIGDGQGDQVYSCGREPSLEHARAVSETAGQVLRYQETQVAAFYVAGALQDPPDCTGGLTDPTDTEKWVTYNLGLSGDAINQTELGFVDPGNFANRGCMSQNGSDCLSLLGDDHASILRFYYGDDIEIVTAEGPCIDGSGPDAGPDTSGDGSGAGCGCSSGGVGAGSWLVLLLLPLMIKRRA